MNIDITKYEDFRIQVLSMIDECDSIFRDNMCTEARKGQLMSKVIAKYTA